MAVAGIVAAEAKATVTAVVAMATATAGVVALAAKETATAAVTTATIVTTAAAVTVMVTSKPMTPKMMKTTAMTRMTQQWRQ